MGPTEDVRLLGGMFLYRDNCRLRNRTGVLFVWTSSGVMLGVGPRFGLLTPRVSSENRLGSHLVDLVSIGRLYTQNLIYEQPIQWLLLTNLSYEHSNFGLVTYFFTVPVQVRRTSVKWISQLWTRDWYTVSNAMQDSYFSTWCHLNESTSTSSHEEFHFVLTMMCNRLTITKRKHLSTAKELKNEENHVNLVTIRMMFSWQSLVIERLHKCYFDTK